VASAWLQILSSEEILFLMLMFFNRVREYKFEVKHGSIQKNFKTTEIAMVSAILKKKIEIEKEK
jgi:hypothetical protein